MCRMSIDRRTATAIAGRAGVDTRTVQKIAAGESVREASRRVAMQAARELGIDLVPTPSAARHQSVNLRGDSGPGVAGDAATAALMTEERHAAYRRMTHRFEVAPRCRVATPQGEILKPGDEVNPAEWDGLLGLPGWQHVEKLVRGGTVLDARNGDAPPEVQGLERDGRSPAHGTRRKG